MFLLRWIKSLVFLALIVVAVFWLARYKVHGEPLYKTVSSYIASGSYKETFKDLKTFVGGLLQSVGAEIQQDEVSEKDRKQFESLIKTKTGEGAKK